MASLVSVMCSTSQICRLGVVSLYFLCCFSSQVGYQKAPMLTILFFNGSVLMLIWVGFFGNMNSNECPETMP